MEDAWQSSEGSSLNSLPLGLWRELTGCVHARRSSCPHPLPPCSGFPSCPVSHLLAFC